MNKYLIIGVSALLIISLTFGYSYQRSFEFFSDQIENVSKLANDIAGIGGNDTANPIPTFLPELNNAELSSYYDEETKKLYNVRDSIKSLLPTWLRVADKQYVTVKVFPTTASIKLNYIVSSFSLQIDSTSTSANQITYQKYSINHAIRLYVEVRNQNTQRVYKYNLFIFKVPDTGRIGYFCTQGLDNIGTFSYALNNYSQVLADITYNNTPTLNSAYIERLNPNYQDTSFSKYLYEKIGDIQSTGEPLWLYFGDFIKKGE